MGALGYLPVVPFGRIGRFDDIDALAWAPDGKSITFVYRGAFYKLNMNIRGRSTL